MDAGLPDLTLETWRPHPLHAPERCWPETNCYNDLWIELLHALGLPVEAALGFTARQDFEGDQFGFTKFPLEDLETLDRLTAQIRNTLADVPGVADLAAEANKGKPQLVIKVDRAAAARLGINADEILEIVQSGIGGSSVSTLIEGTRRFDIAVRLADSARSSPAAIAAIPIRTAEGALVPFSQVAKILL